MNKTEIEALASVHLGKAGDGTVVKPYVTPDSVDASLLVGVPRRLNRTDYQIDDDNLPFVGFDTWNCYEFSTLTDNGFPVTGLLRIVYPADTPNIVESKSLKLYLNSYNMMKNGLNINEVITNIKKRVVKDLTDTVQGPVEVGFVSSGSNSYDPFGSNQVMFNTVEQVVNISEISFTHYNESPDILEIIECTPKVYMWHSATLRSNCRVTNQPDWADVFVIVKGDLTFTPESLLQYIVSMRKENHFHEEVIECMYKRLYDLLNPEELLVAGLYSRRGGIDINPIRASSDDLVQMYAMNLEDPNIANVKTLKQ